MAILGLGKKKKDDSGFQPLDQPPPAATKTGTPTDSVVSMRQQGLSNNQIIQSLQEQGYAPNQIFDAMNQADIKGGPENMNPSPEAPVTPPPAEPSYANPSAQSPQYYEQEGREERIEEIAEAIIEEKWNELVKNINKIIDWKDKTEAKISQLEQKFKDLKSDFDELHSAVLGKVGKYDQNIMNIGAEIKAMEKVFQKILPSFTENVNELSRLTKEIKKSPSRK